MFIKGKTKRVYIVDFSMNERNNFSIIVIMCSVHKKNKTVHITIYINF